MADFNENYYCPITQEVLVDPVQDREGNTYERTAIEEWICIRGKSPITRSPLTIDDLVPNRALKAAIDSERASLPAMYPGASGGPMDPHDPIHSQPLPVPELNLPPLDLSVSCIPVKDIFPEQDTIDTYVLASVKPRADIQRIPSDIVVCIDCSGSMGTEATAAGVESSGLNMLDIVKHATNTIIEVLGDNDRLAIVKYSNGATVTADLTATTDGGKVELKAKLAELNEGGMTNLWDGIKKSLELLEARVSAPFGGVSGNSRNASVFVLTDGVPNVEPPRGWLPTLQRFKDQHGGKYPGTINTFGFGYNLNSTLLHDIAVEAKGAYGFIPDSGFVGTIFVNALANTLSTFVEESTMAIAPEPANAVVTTCSVGDVQGQSNEDGITFAAKTVQIGQALGYVTRITAPVTDSPLVLCNLKYKHTGDAREAPQKQVIVTGPSEPTSNEADRQEVAYEVFRLQVVTAIDSVLSIFIHSGSNAVACEVCCRKFDATVACITKWLDSHSEVPSAPVPGSSAVIIPAYKRIGALLEDVKGQLLEAVVKPEYYDKWGAHFLRSIKRAHELKQCNNFKDPGVQNYGSPTFETLRDEADDKFSSLPPPIPKPQSNINMSAYGSRVPPMQSRSIDMSSFNSRDHVCFHEYAQVQLSAGLHKSAKSIIAGDILSSGAVIECVVETVIPEGMAYLVRCPGSGLLVTPWHPLKRGEEWVFPIEIGEIEYIPCNAVYSYVARDPVSGDYSSEVVVDGEIGATLAHGLIGIPKVSHDFFGTSAVIEALKMCPGWNKGRVTFRSNDEGFLERDAESQLVTGIRVI